MINAVLFDLDGTLVNREKGAIRWLRSHYEELIAPHDEFVVFHEQFKELDQRGNIHKLETFGVLARTWNWDQTPEEIWTDYRQNVWRYCELFPDVLLSLDHTTSEEF